MKKFALAIVLTVPLLVGCSSVSAPQAGEESTQSDCPLGHWQDDWDNKKVKVGTETYQKYNSTKKRYETKTRDKYETKRAYDGQDWICDVPPSN